MSEPTELQLFKARLSTHFWAKLQDRTGWGKNDVYAVFEMAMRDAEIEMLREKLEKSNVR